MFQTYTYMGEHPLRLKVGRKVIGHLLPKAKFTFDPESGRMRFDSSGRKAVVVPKDHFMILLQHSIIRANRVDDMLNAKHLRNMVSSGVPAVEHKTIKQAIGYDADRWQKLHVACQYAVKKALRPYFSGVALMTPYPELLLASFILAPGVEFGVFANKHRPVVGLRLKLDKNADAKAVVKQYEKQIVLALHAIYSVLKSFGLSAADVKMQSSYVATATLTGRLVSFVIYL